MRWFFFLFVLSSSALASPGQDAVSDGDRAHFERDYRTARTAYRLAIASGEPAAEVMARLRLLPYSGNLGAWVHWPNIERALRELSGEDEDLALMDFHLFAPSYVGADKAEAQRLAEALLDRFPAEAMARLYLCTQDSKWLEQLAKLPRRDGLGDGLVATQGVVPPNPGSLNVGLSFTGAPGVGVGAGLSLRHSDFGGWNAGLFLGASTQGYRYVIARLRSLRKMSLGTYLRASRGLMYFYADSERESIWRDLLLSEIGPALRLGDFRFSLNGIWRKDDVGEGWQSGHGLSLGGSWNTTRGWGANRRGASVALEFETALWGSYSHQNLFVDSRLFVGAFSGVLATRLTHQHAFDPDVPKFRLPVVGGFYLHRGAYVDRWRAPWISTIDVEQRWMVFSPVELVLFSNAAWVAQEGIHPAGGVGLRLILPPEESNISRLDFAVSDTGWGLYAAYGEAF